MLNKVLFILIFLASASSTLAQEDSYASPKGHSSIGIFGGFNLQNINGKDAYGNKLSNTLVPKYVFGINYEIPIAPDFFIQPGLQFMTKGTKGTIEYSNNIGKHNITRELKLNYLELPINFVFKPLLGTGHIVLGFGPYIGYCIGGKAKFTGTSIPSDTDIQFEKTVPENDPNNLIYYKRMDVGANFFFGYEMQNGVNLILNSQLGLININSSTTSKLQNKNTGFGLALGYRF